MPSTDGSPEERILLLLAPAEAMVSVATVLGDAELACVLVPSLDALVELLQDGAGVLVVDAECITERAIRLLATALSQRAPWSNLPIVVLTDGTPASIERLDALTLFGPATSVNVTILERPLHAATLTTVVRSGLRARRRQYEVRALLNHLASTNEQLRATQAALQTANATLEERVATRTEQVRTLALALTAAEQRERTRISRILHDHLQQLLHGAKIWADLLVADGALAPPEAPTRVRDLLQDAIDTTRSLAVDLSPPVLRNEGFRPALAWLAQRMQDHYDLTVTLEPPTLPLEPDADLRDLLFRVTRELLFNVVKHAGVNAATVHVSSSADAYVVDVIDGGIGFDCERQAARSDAGNHSGLGNARTRLDLVGGTLSVDTAPGEGTRVRVQVPLRAS
ncbi:MAG: sensor histidine kinase [Salinibacter sp.]